ncbi:MAG: amino acid adenylation domain-containing protein [Candidatus Aminicenantes bacterium]|nr:amino acid adenylation domain-containing protein [Candidatus Aminicenantes bacterium]NIM78673.1 amino acid adenylation domain-containing protein [Candidatus Aminicenantes bacterium]NIN17920.1 amino acid adenylation domain-containing protein [Candidatus Aminicenantes bacterium]NIN41823.1 amino acid adenylation domain-containing protein [Candidatus Aminicenantes bacterium]NIN84575.1 amino acid adenylation domain-containing protein [Candidatus Aminicenantes bacterium]
MNPVKYYELSNPQKRIWFTEASHDHKDMSNIGYLIELKGEYNLEKLARTIKYVVKVNTALQLRFNHSEDKSELLQYMPDYKDVEVAIIEADSEEELFKKIEKIHRERFDITGNYLCAFAVFSINKKRYGFFESAHHLVADGISATIVAREVMETYPNLDSSDFKEIKKEFSYMDFLKDEKEYIGSEKYEKSKAYWLQKLEDFEGDEITFALNKNKKNSLKVKRLSLKIPGNMIELVEAYKSNNRFSNFGLFMAALGIYFNRFMNREDIIIGMPVHNRSKKIFRDMVGMFVSTIPFRIKFNEKWSFNELVAYVKKELWESLKHQGFPYNHLVKELKDLNIDASGFLNVQLIELPEAIDEYTEKRAFFSTEYNISQLSIYLNQQKSKNLEDLDIAVDYHADIFEEREIEFFFKRLMVILDQAIKEPEKEISKLSLLEDAEYNELIFELNDTKADFPGNKTLPQLFEEQVLKNPGNIALEYEDQTVTYQELDQLTDKLAAKLQGAGITTGSIVGMLCERSIEAIVSIMGVLKAGGAYLPIDPEYPVERKNYIINNSGIKILLIEKALEQRESKVLNDNLQIKNIIVDYQTLEEESGAEDFQKPAVNSENLAYVIYTSGTTGNPKGTLLRHRNVINYIWWGAGVYVKGETVSFPLFTSLSFDLTVTSIFIPLVTGNKIVIYRESEEGLLVERVARENKVDIVKLTPSHLKVVNQLKLENSRIKSFILGGEELKTDTARETIDRFGREINIYNEYGPTETAVGCMIHRYDRNRDDGLAVPIGKPSNNVRIYILDKNKKPLPLGVIGEIYIAGEGVARGYLDNEQLTEEKFVDDPFIPGEKMYRSGDLGRWNLDKILEFYGRCDEQVKIRGYRIEPGEIEKQLIKIEGIKDAVVALSKGPQVDLCAYLVVEEQKEFEVSQLRELLSRELPVYMLPAEFVQVESIPLTRNGKVDFRKLETMGKKLGAAREYAPPRDEMETMLAEIWAAVLGAERVGITDNFFELGGDSIKAVQIAARLNDAGKSVNVKDVLSQQTIANLCANVDFDSHIRQYEQGTIEGEKGPTPIESWFLAQDFHDPNLYHQSVLLEFKTLVDIPILEKAFEELIAHHDGLRLNYNKEKDLFYFNNDLIGKSFKIDVVDLSAVPEAERAAQIETRGYEAKGGFDITAGLMLRAVVFKAEKESDKLLLILHHLVTDGLTWRIILEELYNLYEALHRQKEVDLPQKTASLSDWHDALLMYRESGKLDKEKEYWQQAGAVDFRLPYDREPGDVDWRVKNQATVNARLDQEQTAFLLKDAHEVYKSDVQILVFAALVRTLRQWTGKQNVAIEMESHGRHIDDIDTSKTTGWFTAIYPVVVNRDDKTISDEIKSVKEAIRKTPNNGIGYGILKYMSDEGKTMETKRAEVRFNYLGQFHGEVENPLFSYCQQLTGSDVALENHMTAAVEINAMVLNDVFTADINYNKEAFDESTMVSFAGNYIKNLEEILEHIRNEDDVHFTPSDFDTVDLGEDDLAALFE